MIVLTCRCGINDGRLQLSLMPLLFAVMALIVASSCSREHATPIEIESVFMRALPPNQTTGAVYLKITNNSALSQALNYVHSPIADHIEIHRTIYDSGLMRMRPVQRFTLNPQQTEVFRPGGFHLMLHGIYDNLEPGSSFDIIFEFESGEVVATQAQVRTQG